MCIYESSYPYLPRKIPVCKCICIKLNISLCGLHICCVTTGSVLTPALGLSNLPFLETDQLLMAFFPFRVPSQYRYWSIGSVNQHLLGKLSWKTVLTCSSFCLLSDTAHFHLLRSHLSPCPFSEVVAHVCNIVSSLVPLHYALGSFHLVKNVFFF